MGNFENAKLGELLRPGYYLVLLAVVALPLTAQEVKISKEDPLEIASSSMNVNNKTREVTYTGAVVVKHGGSTLKAEKLVIQPNSDKMTAEKNIEFIAKNKTRSTGDLAEYVKSNKHLTMTGNVSLVSEDKEKIKTNIHADVMEMFGDEDRALAKGSVDMTREDIRVKCGKADLDDKKDCVVLEGDPVVTKVNDSFKGKKLTIYFTKRLLVAEEDVKARFFAKGAGE